VDPQVAVQNMLREALLERQRKNPAFSLRAFAHKLKMSPSAVSEVLAGKRRISEKLAERIMMGLMLTPEESIKIKQLFNKEREIQGATVEKKKSSRYLRLSADHFHIVADWFHFAILSLFDTKNYKDEPTWIAKKLKIRESDADAALDRMVRLGLLQQDNSGKLTPTSAHLESPDDVVNLALRKAHHQNLELAARSLEEDAVEVRDITSMTMAIDRKKLPEAKRMIREFQDKLAALLESGDRQDVYKLNVHLFPLSTLEEESES
jgi:uncharacterized protein (TIGR02147 family)